MILKPQFQILDVLKTIKKYKPTIFPGVPSMYMAINNFRGVRKYGIQSIKACISGSAPLPVEVQEAFEKLTKGRLVEGYGLDRSLAGHTCKSAWGETQGRDDRHSASIHRGRDLLTWHSATRK